MSQIIENSIHDTLEGIKWASEQGDLKKAEERLDKLGERMLVWVDMMGAESLPHILRRSFRISDFRSSAYHILSQRHMPHGIPNFRRLQEKRLDVASIHSEAFLEGND